MSRAAHPAPRVPELLVQLTSSQLSELVRDAVTEALAELEPAQAPALLTQDQLAQRLGCSTRTVYTLRQAGLPTVWLLDSPRFDLGEVLAWLRSRANDSADLAGRGKTPVPKVEPEGAQVHDIARVRAGGRKPAQLATGGSRGGPR